MFIKELKIENFKGFKGEHIFKFDKNFTFLAGDNNTGKSSIFEAVEFLQAGVPKTKKVEDLRNKNTNGHLFVTIKFQGDLSETVKDFSEEKYLGYIFEENGNETIIAKRTSEESVIYQGKKEVKLDISKITLWNNTTKQFENPSGIDSVFKSLFAAQFIWADTNPDDISDFGSTKICGRLLDGVVGDFFESDQWETFKNTHEETFRKGKTSLAARTKDLEKKIGEIISNQYGLASINFNFQLPDITSFIKAGDININDGTETSSKEKGTGMQRALAIALVQVYAEEITQHPEDPKKKKPLFLFIDEPETFLHPKAQDKLLNALDIISKTQQIFITTHSPYLLGSFNPQRHELFICKKFGDTNEVKSSTNLAHFGKSSPTWGEINYFAFDLVSIEFHNELYGFVQAKAILIDQVNYIEEDFDNYLITNGLPKSKTWIKLNKDRTSTSFSRTLPTFIRNYIHHPENDKNTSFTSEELKSSIEELIKLL